MSVSHKGHIDPWGTASSLTCKQVHLAAVLMTFPESQEGHDPVTATANGIEVAVEFATPSVGGLSENDFICAAKINQLTFADLLAKKKVKYWA